jgi:hypothetical protein
LLDGPVAMPNIATEINAAHHRRAAEFSKLPIREIRIFRCRIWWHL